MTALRAALEADAAKKRQKLVAKALRAAKGNIGEAATALGLSRRMLTYYLAADPALRAIAEESRPKAKE